MPELVLAVKASSKLSPSRSATFTSLTMPSSCLLSQSCTLLLCIKWNR